MDILPLIKSVFEEPAWLPVALTVLFALHTAAFILLYFKRRKFYLLLLIIAFPFLVLYYLLKSLQIDLQGMIWLRWIGIGLAAVSLLIFIGSRLKKKFLPEKK